MGRDLESLRAEAAMESAALDLPERSPETAR
jgi:hypothetical protein